MQEEAVLTKAQTLAWLWSLDFKTNSLSTWPSQHSCIDLCQEMLYIAGVLPLATWKKLLCPVVFTDDVQCIWLETLKNFRIYEKHKIFSRYSSKTAFVDFPFLYFIFVLTSSQLPDILNISYYVFFWNKETQPRKIEHANIQHISLGLWQSPIPWSLVLIAFICALRNLL